MCIGPGGSGFTDFSPGLGVKYKELLFPLQVALAYTVSIECLLKTVAFLCAATMAYLHA